VSVIFRNAAAGDSPGLAELIHLADQAHYTTSGYALTIGGSREHQLSELSKLVRAKARSLYHFSHFEVAEAEDGNIVASVAGFDREQTDAQMVAALEEIGWEARTIEELAERIGPLAECMPEELPCTWTIEHVATLPSHRGLGLARKLLERVLLRGAERGFLLATVDVFLGNSKARALYQSAGFEMIGEFGHGPMREILGRDALERMMQPLPGRLAGTIEDPVR
jgi:GNAT superfamily N-acetyltransferase